MYLLKKYYKIYESYYDTLNTEWSGFFITFINLSSIKINSDFQTTIIIKLCKSMYTNRIGTKVLEFRL